MNLFQKIKSLFKCKEKLTEETRCLVCSDSTAALTNPESSIKVKPISKDNPQVSILDEHETAVVIAEVLQKWISSGKMKSYKHVLPFIKKWKSLGLVTKYDDEEEFIEYRFTANEDVKQLSKDFKFFHYKTPSNESNKIIDWMRALTK